MLVSVNTLKLLSTGAAPRPTQSVSAHSCSFRSAIASSGDSREVIGTGPEQVGEREHTSCMRVIVDAVHPGRPRRNGAAPG